MDLQDTLRCHPAGAGHELRACNTKGGTLSCVGATHPLANEPALQENLFGSSVSRFDDADDLGEWRFLEREPQQAQAGLGRQYWALASASVVSQCLDPETASKASMTRLFWWKHTKVLVLCGIVASLQAGGCANSEPHETRRTESSPDMIRCTEPRPEMCTQEYLPVCANLKNGTKQTYASGCVACSDANVVSFRPDPCE